MKASKEYLSFAARMQRYQKCLETIAALPKENCWSAVLDAKRCLQLDDKYRQYFYCLLEKTLAALYPDEKLTFEVSNFRTAAGPIDITCHLTAEMILGLENSTEIFFNSGTTATHLAVFIDKALDLEVADVFILWLEDILDARQVLFESNCTAGSRR